MKADMCWQQNICPLCERTFQVTPTDDIFIPACGCYDDAEPGHYPCEACGLPHVYACLDKGPAPELRFTAIVSDGQIVAQAEGKDDGNALIGEFFVASEGE